MKLILVNGKKRSGKDYFARSLSTLLRAQGKSAEVMSFADPMKEIISTTFGITLAELDDYKNDPYKYIVSVFEDDFGVHETTFRKILQLFGTEAMKSHFGDDVWINLLLKRAAKSKADYVIVPDFRFKVELVSDITVNVANKDIVSTDTHPSETELDEFEFSYYIDNTGQPDMKESVLKFIEHLNSK